MRLQNVQWEIVPNLGGRHRVPMSWSVWFVDDFGRHAVGRFTSEHWAQTFVDLMQPPAVEGT